MRYILQFLGIYRYLYKQLPVFFFLLRSFLRSLWGGLAIVLFVSFLNEVIFTQDSADGLMTAAKIVHPLKALCTHKRILPFRRLMTFRSSNG
jgi:lipid-A-disaccharide synthase-like uncharacterized protein